MLLLTWALCSELDCCSNTFELQSSDRSDVIFVKGSSWRCVAHLHSTLVWRLYYSIPEFLSPTQRLFLYSRPHPQIYNVTKFPWWSLAILRSSKSSSGVGIDMVSCHRRRLPCRASNHMAQAKATLRTPRTNVRTPKTMPIVLSVERAFPRENKCWSWKAANVIRSEN